MGSTAGLHLRTSGRVKQERAGPGPLSWEGVSPSKPPTMQGHTWQACYPAVVGTGRKVPPVCPTDLGVTGKAHLSCIGSLKGQVQSLPSGTQERIGRTKQKHVDTHRGEQ